MCVLLPPSSPHSPSRVSRPAGPMSSESETHNPTAATSTTPTGLFALLLASGGNFLLPIALSAAQLAASRRWPDTDIPQDIERAKVVVNVAGAATTSLVAALKHWRVARMAAAAAAMAAAATERTALLAGQTRSTYPSKTSKRRAGEKRRVRFDADLIDINMKEDQAQMAVSLPVL
jgi:hypothetical protein